MTPAFINYLKDKYQKLQRIVRQHEHRKDTR
jgi:DNA polymerase II small subunit/DNA polymerase delta subunit B